MQRETSKRVSKLTIAIVLALVVVMSVATVLTATLKGTVYAYEVALQQNAELVQQHKRNTYVSYSGSPNQAVDLEYSNSVDDKIVEIFATYVLRDIDGYIRFEKPTEILQREYGVSDKFVENAIGYIEQNIGLMNEFVSAGLGTIDDELKLVFVEEFYMMSRMNAWGFYITWNKLSFDGDSEFGMVVSIIGIIANVYSLSSAIQDLADPAGALKKIKAVLSAYDIATWIIPMLDDYFAIIFAAISVFVICLTASSVIGAIIKSVIEIILAIFNPNINDNAKVLEITMSKPWATVHYQACWIPWFGDSWGASIDAWW